MENLPQTVTNGIVPATGSLFFNIDLFEHAQRVAALFKNSSMVPDTFKDIGNCVIALNYAQRVNADPFMVMQNMYVVHGKPGLESKFGIAVFNASGKWSPLKFRYNDARTSCTAYSTDLRSKETVDGVTVTLEMAKAEGWSSKSGSKWKTMPELMLMYRAAMFFIRAYAPETLLGMQSREEIYDTMEMSRAPDGTFTAMTEKDPEPSDLKQKVTAATAEDSPEPDKVKCDLCDQMCSPGRGMTQHKNAAHPGWDTPATPAADEPPHPVDVTVTVFDRLAELSKDHYDLCSDALTAVGTEADKSDLSEGTAEAMIAYVEAHLPKEQGQPELPL